MRQRASHGIACNPARRLWFHDRMNLLILGGTGFLGPAIVDHALARGWQVTLFNRGRTNPGRF